MLSPLEATHCPPPPTPELSGWHLGAPITPFLTHLLVSFGSQSINVTKPQENHERSEAGWIRGSHPKLTSECQEGGHRAFGHCKGFEAKKGHPPSPRGGVNQHSL